MEEALHTKARGQAPESRCTEKPSQIAGAIYGLNIFVGALLGTNLGTLQSPKLVHCLQVASLLAALVMALLIVSTAEDRRRQLVGLGGYVAL